MLEETQFCLLIVDISNSATQQNLISYVDLIKLNAFYFLQNELNV